MVGIGFTYFYDYVCMDRLDTAVVDVGPPAEWVKINVQRTVSFKMPIWIYENAELSKFKN